MRKYWKRVLTIMLVLSVLMGVCGCQSIPFLNKDKRTKNDFQQEAMDLSERILRRILAGDFDSVDRYIRDVDKDNVKSVVDNMAPGLANRSTITIEEVFTEDGSYDTEVHYRLSIYYMKEVSSVSFVMRLERSGDSWIVSNASTLFFDIEALNEKYAEELQKEDEAKK